MLFRSPSEAWPTVWLLFLFAVAIGLPFFVVSANAPLLQDWFRSSGDKHAHDPYFLYAASNIGSIGALIAYPIFIEVFFGLKYQGTLWSIGFGLLLILIMCCGWTILKKSPQHFSSTSKEADEEDTDDLSKPSISNYGHWIILAFVPSAYLLSVTNKITTDLLATPLLWVIPLTLYLLTFVIVFSRNPIIRHQLIAKIAPYCVLVLAFVNMSISQADTVLGVILTSLIGFFLITLYCHGRLAEARPPAKYLTNFYIAMSFGGVLGGIFVGIIAPTIFSNIYEYALLLAMAAFLMPTAPKSLFSIIHKKFAGRIQNYKADVIIILCIFGILLTARNVPFDELNIKPLSYVLLFTLLILLIDSAARPFRLGICVALGLFFSGQLTGISEGFVFQKRSFFGVYTVKEEKDEDHDKIKRPYPHANIAKHGTTIHGIQRIGSLEPLSYYHPQAGLGKLLQAYEDKSVTIKEVGAIGLGAGTAICYRQPGQNWTFFEIDPLVEVMARDPNLFTYMSDCGEDSPVIIGDARLSLHKIKDNTYDLLVADAFSSDSIPVHLLTREAFELYKKKIKDNGIIILHVSNRYFKLEPIVAKISNTLDLASRIYHFERTDEEQKLKPYRFNSTWIAIAKDASVLDAVIPLSDNLDGKKDNIWRSLEFGKTDQLWTDDYSNVLSALHPKIWTGSH